MHIPDIIIAVDGYSATGKSSVAKLVAKQFGFLYLDSGALYRGVTLYALENGLIDPEKGIDEAALQQALGHLDLTFRAGDGGGTYMETAVNHMLEKGIDTDFAVFLTDTEEYGTGWLTAWKKYHVRHPKAVAFVLRGDSYMTTPIPEAEAEKLNVYQIFGWNDSVIDYMKFVLEKRKNT